MIYPVWPVRPLQGKRRTDAVTGRIKPCHKRANIAAPEKLLVCPAHLRHFLILEKLELVNSVIFLLILDLLVLWLYLLF